MHGSFAAFWWKLRNHLLRTPQHRCCGGCSRVDSCILVLGTNRYCAFARSTHFRWPCVRVEVANTSHHLVWIERGCVCHRTHLQIEPGGKSGLLGPFVNGSCRFVNGHKTLLDASIHSILMCARCAHSRRSFPRGRGIFAAFWRKLWNQLPHTPQRRSGGGRGLVDKRATVLCTNRHRTSALHTHLWW